MNPPVKPLNMRRRIKEWVMKVMEKPAVFTVLGMLFVILLWYWIIGDHGGE